MLCPVWALFGVSAAEPQWCCQIDQQAGIGYLAGGLPDRAPSGVPDFSTCRQGWGRRGEPGQWTHSGPVALADVLWWLDSVAEPQPAAPPAVWDGHPLVTAYPHFGPAWDDHATDNVVPLVDELAGLASTGGRPGGPAHGTDWAALQRGAREYLVRRGLAAAYEVRGMSAWRPEEVSRALEAGAGAVLLLGVWEAGASGGPRRVGGHYAALAGAAMARGGAADLVALADPLADGGQDSPGRRIPTDPLLHSCREAPRAHDDPAVVAHDTYRLSGSGLPGSPPILEGYFTPSTYGEAAAFVGLNSAAFLAPYEGEWTGGAVVMAVDAVMVVAPSAPTPPATPSPGTPTPPRGATATAPPPTDPASPSPTPPPPRPTAAGGWRIAVPVAFAGS